MSPTIITTCNKIRRIVALRQMLRRWRKTAASHRISTTDVPSGHIAICIGKNLKRFIIRATYLNHPIFQKLLIQVEEEYGFVNQGPLTIPCDESLFEDILRFVSRTGSCSETGNIERFQKFCHVDCRMNVGESRPLLHGAC